MITKQTGELLRNEQESSNAFYTEGFISSSTLLKESCILLRKQTVIHISQTY